MTDDFDELTGRIAGQQYQLSSDATQRHQAMLRALTSETDPAPAPAPAEPVSLTSRRRTRSMAIIAAAVVATAGIGVGTAAAFGVFSAEPTSRDIAHCYATTDLDDPSNHTDFMVAQGPANPDGVVDAAGWAMEVCTGGWMQGRFSDTDPKVSDPDPSRTDFPVPELTPCVLEDGSVGVFPGPERVCADLGLGNALL